MLLEAMADDIGEFGLAQSTEEPDRMKKTTKKRLNYDPNKARNERRTTLIQLRNEAETLETKLKQLQIVRGHHKKPSGQAKGSQPKTAAGMPHVWKECVFANLTGDCEPSGKMPS